MTLPRSLGSVILKTEMRHPQLHYFRNLTSRTLHQSLAVWDSDGTVYPKKYAHGFCFAVLCCGYTLTDFPISIRLTSLALWQSNDCPSASKATLMNMDKYFVWIHYERLHNHNKAKHNKTVCIFLGIYCMATPSVKSITNFQIPSTRKKGRPQKTWSKCVKRDVNKCDLVGVDPWASYQIRKIAGCTCAGNAGNVFPHHRLQRKPLVSDPGMHHGTCVTHVPWCMSGSLTRGGRENVREPIFDIAWCCQPHGMGHGQHLNLKWIWMNVWMNIHSLLIQSLSFVLSF